MRKREDIEKKSKEGNWIHTAECILEVLLDIRALVGIKDILEKLENEDLSNSLLKDGTPF